MFAWTYKDLKGVSLELCVHRISLMLDAWSVWNWPYCMNKNYATKLQEEIAKMLEVGIIFKVQTSEWVSLIVISLKKEANKIRMCGFLVLKCSDNKRPLSIPVIDTALEEVVGHEMYSFMDGFFGYNQINIVEEDRLKTTFVVEDGVYAYNRMPFGLCNALATFQRIILHIFNRIATSDFRAFLDDWSVFSGKETHLPILQECMDHCRRPRLALNPKKSWL